MLDTNQNSLTSEPTPLSCPPTFLESISCGLSNPLCSYYWIQFWSVPKWAAIKGMGRDRPRPTMRIELEEEVAEVAEIA